MTDTPTDFGPITEVPPAQTNGIVTPQPEGELPEGLPETPDAASQEPESAAARVRSRLRGVRAGTGRAPGEPSASASAPRSDKPPTWKPVPPKPREGQLVKPLTELYMSMGMMLAPIDPVCSMAFIENAETCAKSLETLARENETVRRAILALTQTSAWGGVIIAHMPILLLVTMHHGPEKTRDRIAPMAAMMNPAAMQRAAEAQQQRTQEDAPSE